MEKIHLKLLLLLLTPLLLDDENFIKYSPTVFTAAPEYRHFLLCQVSFLALLSLNLNLHAFTLSRLSVMPEFVGSD